MLSLIVSQIVLEAKTRDLYILGGGQCLLMGKKVFWNAQLKRNSSFPDIFFVAQVSFFY